MALEALIDEGHVETAPGANGYISETYYNKVYANAIAGWVRYFGGSVTILNNGNTKATDISIPVGIANTYIGKGLMLSVHCNSYSDPTATGFEVIVQKGHYSGLTKSLADFIFNNYKIEADKYGLRARVQSASQNIKEMDLGILRNTKIPACLIELGFVSNGKDAAIISSPAFIDAQTKIIAKTLMGIAGQRVIEPKPVEVVEVQEPPLTNEELRKIRALIK